MVNASPEPVSNVAVSTAEDVATVGLLYVAYEFPLLAGGIALFLLALTHHATRDYPAGHWQGAGAAQTAAASVICLSRAWR